MLDEKPPMTPEEVAHWEAVLLKLSPRTLEIFLLVAVDRLNFQQVAARLWLPTFWVRHHMTKAIIHIARNSPASAKATT